MFRTIVRKQGDDGARSYPDHFAERVRSEMGRRYDAVINSCVNDSGRGAIERENFATHVRKLVRRTCAIGAVPLLQTMNTIALGPRHSALPSFVEIIQRIAREEGIIVVDHWAHWQKQGDVSDWLNDAIHPNATGHAEMAKVMFRTLGIFDPKRPACQLGAK